MSTATQPVTSAVTEEVKQAAPPTAATTEETQVAVPGQETVEQPAEVVEQEEQELNLDEAPEGTGDFSKYKEHFKTSPELRQILGQHKAMTELRGEQPFSEFRAIHELFPTLQDAEEVSNLANQHREMGRVLRESPQDFLDSLRESDSNAYSKLVQSLPQILAEEDRELYSSQARYYVSEVMDNLYRAGQGNQEFLTALGTVAQALGINMGMPNATRPANTEADKLRQQLKDREEADRQQQYQNFHSSVETSFMENVVTEIESGVKKLIPTANQEQLEIIVPRIWQAVNSRLEAQPQTKADVQKRYESARKGRTGQAEQREFLDFLNRKAKLVLPLAIKEEVNKWTKAALATNNTKTEKKQDIAARSRDVGSGPQGTSSVSASQPNGKPRKFNEIIGELQSGTYVKR